MQIIKNNFIFWNKKINTFLQTYHIKFIPLNIIFRYIIQFISFKICMNFDPFILITENNFGFQFFYNFNWNSIFGINYIFGIDSISLSFIILTIYIFNLCQFIAMNLQKNYFLFIKWLYFLEIILIIDFFTLDLFLFYILFELSLIPMFILIGNWGARSRKIKASFYLLLYTIVTATLTLIAILYLWLQIGSTFYPDLFNFIYLEYEQKIIWFFFFITFITKIPTLPFHIWLPEAHVEAPTIGSIILAAILLKIGGYGILRYLLPIFPKATHFFLPLIYTLALISIIYASFITLRQFDLKRIIAYSSIAHMNFVIIGLFSENNYGIIGAIYLMIGHAIISSALFFAIGIIYDRYHTRLLFYYSGLIQIMPIYGIATFLFFLGNIGFPGTSNFIGEFLILLGSFIKNPFLTIFSGFGILFSGIYSIWLYNRIFFGTLQKNYGWFYLDLNINEFYIFLSLFFFMIILGINNNSIINFFFLNVDIISFLYK